MIVQCPSCSTKFSVESDTIEKATNPRFHCSRCDTYFDLLGKSKRTSLKGARADGKPSDPFHHEAPGEQLSLIPEPQQKASDSSLVVRSRELLSEDAATPPKSPITAQWPDSYAGSPLEADMRSALDETGTDIKYGDFAIRRAGRFRPVIETKSTLISNDEPTIAGDAPERQTLSNFIAEAQLEEFCASDTVSLPRSVLPRGSEPAGAPWEPNLTQQSFVPQESAPRAETARESARTDPSSQDWSSSVVPFPRVRPARPSTPAEAIQRRRGGDAEESRGSAERSSARRSLTNYRDMLIAGAAPLALLGLFGLWSVSFDSTPEALAALARVQVAELPRVAPAGLQLVGLQAEDISLDNGRRLLQLTGSLLNSTDKPYRDIFIEAKLFDRDNRKIESIVVPASSGLSSAGALTSLNPTSIAELQNRTGIARALKPSENMAFRVVFTEVPADAVWYATRVYSVKPAAS